MTLEDIKDKFKDNKLSYGVVKISELADIMKYVLVDLKMDITSFDYYYAINMKNLAESDIPSDILDKMKEQGWSYNNSNLVLNNSNLVLFLKN